MRSRPNSGFTLIELIMVIVIISILAVVIVPQFASQSGKATKAATKANLEILRTAVEAFGAENSGTYPSDFATDLVSSGGTVKFLRKVPEEKWTPATTETPDPTPVDNITAADIASSDVGGWMYNAGTGEVRVNKTGVDFGGEAYGDY